MPNLRGLYESNKAEASIASDLFGMKIVEAPWMPEGWIAFDEGKTILLVGPDYSIRVPKPPAVLRMPPLDPESWRMVG